MPSCPPPRDILAVLSNIDRVNSTLGEHKLKASEALLELALDKDHDKVERRKCATAILRAPFQRYPSAAAINGPKPHKPDDEGDRDDGSDGGDDDDQPPSAPEDLMRAYDHGYWNGYATFPWEKATLDTIEETVENYAAHAPGRQTPLPSGPDRIAPDRSKPGAITPPPRAITPPPHIPLRNAEGVRGVRGVRGVKGLPESSRPGEVPSVGRTSCPPIATPKGATVAGGQAVAHAARPHLRSSRAITPPLPAPTPLPESTRPHTRTHCPWWFGVGGEQRPGLPRRRLCPYHLASGVARAPPTTNP